MNTLTCVFKIENKFEFNKLQFYNVKVSIVILIKVYY